MRRSSKGMPRRAAMAVARAGLALPAMTQGGVFKSVSSTTSLIATLSVAESPAGRSPALAGMVLPPVAPHVRPAPINHTSVVLAPGRSVKDVALTLYARIHRTAPLPAREGASTVLHRCCVAPQPVGWFRS